MHLPIHFKVATLFLTSQISSSRSSDPPQENAQEMSDVASESTFSSYLSSFFRPSRQAASGSVHYGTGILSGLTLTFGDFFGAPEKENVKKKDAKIDMELIVEDSDGALPWHSIIRTDSEKCKAILLDLAHNQEHVLIIQLLQVEGTENILDSILEEDHEDGDEADAAFFLNHCNACRCHVISNSKEESEEIGDDDIVEEAVYLFEMGIKHPINDLFLFMYDEEPKHVPRLEARLKGNVGLFCETFLFAAGNMRRAGISKLLQLEGASKAIYRLKEYSNRNQDGRIQAKLQFIEECYWADLHYHESVLERLSEISFYPEEKSEVENEDDNGRCI